MKQKERMKQSANSELPADPPLIITTVCLVFTLCQKSRGNIIVREMRPVHTFSVPYPPRTSSPLQPEYKERKHTAVVHSSQHHQKLKRGNDIFPLCVCHFPNALLGRPHDARLKWVYILQYSVESLSCMNTTRYRGIVTRHSGVDFLDGFLRAGGCHWRVERG